MFLAISPLTTNNIPQNLNPDVVIVGGGPVGLWTGIQTALLSGKKVVILEKYQNYMRSDIRLNIDASSLSGIPNDDKLKELVKHWIKKPVPIKDMEESLTSRAHELGITVVKGYQANPSTLPELFPTAKVFIGADGARSGVRKEIFGDEMRFDSNLQYMAQVQYITKPKTQDLRHKDSYQKVKDLAETYSMQKFAEHLIIQNIMPQQDGSSKVSLRIFIDKATYNQITDATFRNPYYFETDLNKVPKALKDVLIKWWGVRKEFHHENIDIEGDRSNKITVIALNSYAAKEVVKVREDGRIWTLVGDAAAAFPFFRAVNNGLLLGTKLAKSIAEGLKDAEPVREKQLASSLKSYSSYTTRRVYIERIRAFVKNLFIGMSKIYLKISNRVPWSPVKLNQNQKKRCYDSGNTIWDQLVRVAPAQVFA